MEMVFDDVQRTAFTSAEMKGLLLDNWPTVNRIAKHIERYGKLTVHLLQSGIAHELCLLHRDMFALHHILCESTTGGDDVVNVALLRENCGKDRLPESATSPRRPPPYAVRGQGPEYSKPDLDERKRRFGEAVRKAAGNKNVISRKAFSAAINRVERFGVSDREAADLYTVLDPKRSGIVNVDEFCERFSMEFLKPKSMRPQLGVAGADGTSNPFEWPVEERAPRSARTPSRPRASVGAEGGVATPRPAPPAAVVKSTRSATLRRLVTAHEAYNAVTKGDVVPLSHLPRLPVQVRPPTATQSSNRGQRINLNVVASPRLLGNVVRPQL